MAAERALAGKAAIVQGGLSSRMSRTRNRVGARWKDRSADKGSSSSGGTTQGRVDGAQAPVQRRDEHLHRRRAQGQHVLGREHRLAERAVCHQAQRERRRRQRQPDDRQVLEVPPVRLVDFVRVAHQVVEAVRERRQPQCVHRR